MLQAGKDIRGSVDDAFVQAIAGACVKNLVRALRDQRLVASLRRQREPAKGKDQLISLPVFDFTREDDLIGIRDLIPRLGGYVGASIAQEETDTYALGIWLADALQAFAELVEPLVRIHYPVSVRADLLEGRVALRVLIDDLDALLLLVAPVVPAPVPMGARLEVRQAALWSGVLQDQGGEGRRSDLIVQPRDDQEQMEAVVQHYGRYEIVQLNWSNNAKAARRETASHMVSLSGGLGSAIAAERAITKYGREQVALWFADTLVEDPSLYDFLHSLLARWGGKLYWFTDGRTPQQVWDDHKIIPNNLLASCSYALKVKAFRQFIKAMPSLPTVFIGFKPGESRRQCNTLASYAAAIPEVRVEYPLMWEPIESRPLMAVCERELGIEPPLLYQLGYNYNNCGGCCCRSGVKSLVRTALFFPDRYAELEAWEERARSQGGARANRSIASRQRDGKKQPLTLAQIRIEYLPKAHQMLKLGSGETKERKKRPIGS